LGSTSNPVAQNRPFFHPTELYAQSGRRDGSGLVRVAGSRERINPGGRKAATAVHSISFPPTLTLSDETNDSFSSSHPIGILPGIVNN
jgi:hypothetical protein